MKKFKLEFTLYMTAQRKNSKAVEDPKVSKTDVNSRLNSLSDKEMGHKKRMKKCDDKKTEEEIQMFRKDTNDRIKKHEEKTKAQGKDENEMNHEEKKKDEDKQTLPKDLMDESQHEDKISETKSLMDTDMAKGFKYADILFEELDNGLVRCAICQIASLRLVRHLNSNEKCTRSFYMPEFKKEYSKKPIYQAT